VEPALDVDRLDQTAMDWLAAQAQITLAGRRAAALNGGRAYDRYRRAEVGAPLRRPDSMVAVGDVAVAPRFLIAQPEDIEQIVTSLRVTGPVRVKQSRQAGRSPDRAMADGLAAVQAAVQRHVLNGGRLAELTLMQADPQVSRYARVVSSAACAFCGMLASRGAVYLDEGAADFDAHDACGCAVEPVMRDGPVTGASAQWQQRWAAYRETGQPLTPQGFAAWLRATP
jgi:hypothetical protein